MESPFTKMNLDGRGIKHPHMSRYNTSTLNHQEGEKNPTGLPQHQSGQEALIQEGYL